ncbi:trem-like transcript 2 protein isoform X3 [Dipodomys spectabilis]|uniref:trem-like transcript 2 protein isoform X3 n=1 Tax=Dipodomys spectabilis TaxID=105255 RepID=UPI001C53ED6D|nr:trem-like transcript 2 protein isoform X3 [Dipodomys spectabilis]
MVAPGQEIHALGLCRELGVSGHPLLLLIRPRPSRRLLVCGELVHAGASPGRGHPVCEVLLQPPQKPRGGQSVVQALTTERDPLLTHPADGLDSGFVTMGHVSTSGSEAPFTSGLLTSSPTTSERARPNSMADYSATTLGPSWTTESPGRARASSAGPASTPTKSRHVNSGFPATGTCHNHLPSVRPQEPYLTVLVAVLTLLPAPVMFAMVYRFWRKRHMGSYRMSSEHPRPWVYLCRAPEPLWKSA